MLNTERIAAAFALAAQVHESQTRKGSDVPYIAHPMAVAAQVLAWHGGEDQFIAALLHDVVEDGGAQYEAIIRTKFGDDVLAMVLACSDAAPAPGEKKAPWLERKRAYLKHVEDARQDALLVSAADKWHNLSAILADAKRLGDAVYLRFVKDEPDPAKKKLLTLWYYRSLADLYLRRGVPGAADVARLLALVEAVPPQGEGAAQD